jgi:hypothetical protein
MAAEGDIFSNVIENTKKLLVFSLLNPDGG